MKTKGMQPTFKSINEDIEISLDDKPYNHGVTYILFKASAFSPVKCGK